MPENKEKNSEKLSRQIRKEVASAVQPLLETVAALQQELKLLKQQTGTPVPPAAETNKKARKEKKNGESEIAKLRGKLKLSKQEFAELFGVSKEEVNAWENCKTKPAGEAAQLLEKLMVMDKKERTALREAITRRRKEER